MNDRLSVDHESRRRMFCVKACLFQKEHELVNLLAIDRNQHVRVTRIASVVPRGQREAADECHW